MGLKRDRLLTSRTGAFHVIGQAEIVFRVLHLTHVESFIDFDSQSCSVINLSNKTPWAAMPAMEHEQEESTTVP